MSRQLLQRGGIFPLGLFFFLFLMSGVVMTLGSALGFFGPGAEQYAGGQAFMEILSDAQTWSSLGLSFWVALSSSLLSLVLGTIMAYGLWRYLGTGSKWASSVSHLYKVPVVLPHITVAFLVIMIWGSSGILSTLFYHLGFGEESREAFSFIHHSPIGLSMIFSYVFKSAPFVTLMVLAVLQKTDRRLLVTAVMLGEKKNKAFQRVILPLLWPVIFASFSIIFLYSFGAYEIPFLLGNSRPEMVSITAYELYTADIYQQPKAMAFLTLLGAFIFLFLLIYFRVISREGFRGRKL
jgi:putative spermidine/putrescine transport system permease protein